MIRDERGITVVELLVGLAIAGLIIGTLVTVIFQIFHTTGWGNAELVVQHDLQNAATWLNRDVLTASEAEVIGHRMVLTIPTFITSTINITYTYSEADGTLTRESDNSSLVIARHVDSEPFPSLPDPIPAPTPVTVTLHSRKGDVPGSGTFALKMRAGGSIQVEAPCQITAEQFDVDSKTASWVITNNGSDLATIKQIEIGWLPPDPSYNGALSMIKFGTIPIWAGDEGPTSWTITKPFWAGETENRTIDGGGTPKTLAFVFELEAVNDEDRYSIEIIFDNGCTVNQP